MKREELRRWIEAQAEPDFQAFSAALVPGADNMAGVRLPILKAKARKSPDRRTGGPLWSRGRRGRISGSRKPCCGAW